MTWWKSRRPATGQADEDLAAAQAEQVQVVAMDDRTKQLERSIKKHLATNHIAERIRAEVLATRRRGPA